MTGLQGAQVGKVLSKAARLTVRCCFSKLTLSMRKRYRSQFPSSAWCNCCNSETAELGQNSNLSCKWTWRKRIYGVLSLLKPNNSPRDKDMSSVTHRTAIKRSWVTVCNNQIPYWKSLTVRVILNGSQHPSTDSNELRANCNCPIKAFLKSWLHTVIFGRLELSAYKPVVQNVIAINFICCNKPLNWF